jgi:hypothetical protein
MKLLLRTIFWTAYALWAALIITSYVYASDLSTAWIFILALLLPLSPWIIWRFLGKTE